MSTTLLRFFTLMTLSLTYHISYGQFVTTWETAMNNESITIPTTGNGYDYEVDWGDGQRTTGHTGNATHTYSTAGIHTVSITGSFPRIFFFSLQAEKEKIKTIETWGNNTWTNMNYAFDGCSFLTLNATDVPNLSNVTDMSGMFRGASSINQPVNNWDVSNVINLSELFRNATTFNQPLEGWDVSRVTDMSSMLQNADSFNQPLENWNVSRVTNMSGMFQTNNSFNQPLENWDVSNVTDMGSMFSFAISFNQSLNTWNVSNVTDMRNMFSDGTAFNQPLDNWNVSKVFLMISMFSDATSFNQPLNNWNVSKVTNMSNMFSDATSFNQPLNNWDVSRVNDMNLLFEGASSFNQSLNDWNVSRVANMSFMFNGATSFNQPLNSWDVSNVRNMSYMFSRASSFNQPLDNWNVNKVISMRQMFWSVPSFDQPLNSWDVSNVTDMNEMFAYASSFNQPLNNWNVSKVTNMSSMFRSATLFNQYLNDWDVHNVTQMQEMFRFATTFNQALNNWNVAKVTNMEDMFVVATAFNQPLNDWDVSNVTDMEDMFGRASSFNQPLDNWNVSKVTNMQSMFRETPTFNQSLNNWNVSKVTDMEGMFRNATDFDQPLGNWNVSNVIRMNNMLSNTSISIEHYDQTLTNWAEQSLKSNITLGADGLYYCEALNARNKLMNDFRWTIIDEGRKCNFTATGLLFHDRNENGIQDGEESGLVNQKVMLSPNNSIAFTDQMGYYRISAPSGEYNLTILPENCYELTTDSASYQLSFPDDESKVYSFGLAATKTIHQMSSTLTSAPTRCESTVPFWLSYQNNGTLLTDGKVKLIPDVNTTYVSSSQPFTTNGDTLIWDFSDLQPTEQRQIKLSFTMPGAEDVGNILSLTHLVESIENNTVVESASGTYNSEIRCIYDSNDKTATPNGLCTDYFTLKDEFLEYRVRFQNTGNDTTFNVVIRDTLQTDLDFNTFEVMASSHNMSTQLEIQDGSLAFHFGNILLPDSIVDEPNSHGFVIFKIKPKSGLPDYTALLNSAFIYFDVNLAIQTNHTLNTLIDAIPSTDTTLSISVCDRYTAPDNQIYTTSGSYTAMIPNEAGCDSLITINLTIKTSTTNTISVSACDSYTAPDNQVYTTSGSYTATIPNEVGCDSLITIDLTIYQIAAEVSLNGETMTATSNNPNNSNLSYQWLDCNDGYAVIDGATNASYIAGENGNYAVTITNNDCVDTSACVQITTVGLVYPPIFDGVNIYPNPTKQFFTIELGNLKQATINIYSYEGRLIKENIKVDTQYHTVELPTHNGVYLVELYAQEYIRMFRVIKQ